MSGVYKWRDGMRIKADPELVGVEIERLSASGPEGQLTPQALVDAARGSNGVLHSLFEWDDAEAANLQRIERARSIIQSLVVTVKMTPKSEPRMMRAFVNVVANGQQGYRTLDSAMADSDLRRQVVQRAWAELTSWRQRYSEYQELAVACSAVDTAMKKRQQAEAKAA